MPLTVQEVGHVVDVFMIKVWKNFNNMQIRFSVRITPLAMLVREIADRCFIRKILISSSM